MAQAETGPTELAILQDVGAAETYISIDLRSLRPDSNLPFDLFQRLHGMYVLYRHRERSFDALTRARLLANGIDHLWVAGDDAPRLSVYYEEHLDAIVRDRALPPDVRANVLQSTTYALAAELLGTPQTEVVGRAFNVVEQLAEFAAVENGAVRHLIGLAEARPGLHVHSANTAIFALTILLASGTNDIGTLANAAIAGMVHDLGLTKVPESILLKPDRLTDAERERVATHPRQGEQLLRSEATLPDEVCEAVFRHHERPDGSGYPEGVGSNDISPLARVIAVAEVFDSLTSHQPWRPTIAPFDAGKFMLTASGLDAAYVQRLIRALRA